MRKEFYEKVKDRVRKYPQLKKELGEELLALQEEKPYIKLINKIHDLYYKIGKEDRADKSLLEDVQLYIKKTLATEKEKLKNLLEDFSPREKDILELRCGFKGNPKTLEEVADIHNITSERVRQIEIRTVRKLRYQYDNYGKIKGEEKQKATVIEEQIKNLKKILWQSIDELESSIKTGRKSFSEIKNILVDKGLYLGIEGMEILSKKVDDLETSNRVSKVLKNANIKYVGDLVQKTERDMLIQRNFGRKSLNEIKNILAEKGLNLGMKIKDIKYK